MAGMTKFQTASPACFDMAAPPRQKKQSGTHLTVPACFQANPPHQNILRTPILTCQVWRIVCIEDLCASK
uniref:Uncharacterized protein n=1 Tax=Neisseria meningitidis alpha153 TaxID=663926 RepID=C6SBG5_NEIME|nr:hypothetical protein predicted by Glimmer/Critica [Neisseria meningitidis alpha153]